MFRTGSLAAVYIMLFSVFLHIKYHHPAYCSFAPSVMCKSIGTLLVSSSRPLYNVVCG